METIQAVTKAAEEEKSPLIIQLFRDDLDFCGADYMVTIANTAASHCTIPISVSLDHGHSYEQAVRCIESGFTGVMIDLSSSEFNENIKSTRRVVKYAHARGVSVEAELGEIFDASASVEVRNSGMTDPERATVFAAKTGIDALAVSIGTAHGLYSSKPVIDFQRAEKIVKSLPCPMVVHGGSNTPDEDIVRLCGLGVAKINVGTDLNLAYNRGLKEAFKKYGNHAFIRDIMAMAREKVVEVARHKIRMFRTYAK